MSLHLISPCPRLQDANVAVPVLTLYSGTVKMSQKKIILLEALRDVFVLTALVLRVIPQPVVLASVMGGQGSNEGYIDNKLRHTELTL